MKLETISLQVEHCGLFFPFLAASSDADSKANIKVIVIDLSFMMMIPNSNPQMR